MNDSNDKYRFLIVLLGLALVVLLRDILLLAFLAVIFGLVLSFPVKAFSRLMPRGLGVVLTLVAVFGSAGAIGYFSVRPLTEQFYQLKLKVPVAKERASAWLRQVEDLNPMNKSKSEPVTSKPSTGDNQGIVRPALMSAGHALFSMTSAFFTLIVTIILAAFFAHEPKSYFEGLETLLPRKLEADFEELWRRLYTGLSHWLQGILISMTIMGAVTAAGLWFAGIPNWPLLAVLTFLGTFIPYIGAISSAVPGLIFGLADSNSKFLAAAAVYLCMHLIEGYLVQPLIMKRAVVIRPGVLLIWQLIMGSLFGILGIIVSTPLLVCVKIMVGYLYIEKELGKKPAEI